MEKFEFKIGNPPPVIDRRTLEFEKYINSSQLPLLPNEVALQTAVGALPWGNMGNDQMKDCTCAAAGHLIMTWTANKTGSAKVIKPSKIERAYENISGYNHKDPHSIDKGAACLDVLKYWKIVGIDGDFITAYMKINLKDEKSLKLSVNLLGGCFVGLHLPYSRLESVDTVWLARSNGMKPNPKVRHVVAAVGYDKRFVTCVSLGKLISMTWAFYITYCEEAYAILSPDWLNGAASIPGFDMHALEQDLKQFKQTNADDHTIELPCL